MTARRIVSVVIAGLLVVSAGCGIMEPPTALDHDARWFMGVLARNRIDSAFASLQVAGNPDTVKLRLKQGHDFISAYALDSAKLVGWNVFTEGSDTRGTLTYEAQGRQGSALLSVDVMRTGSSARIAGFRWQPMAAPLAVANAFSVKGRSVAHYLYLLLAFASAIACFAGALFAGFRRMGVLWVLFCLVGVGKSTINWTTGQQAYNPFSVQLFGAGYSRPGTVGPWYVSWSLPLGTILMFLRWRARRATQTPEAVVAPRST